MSQAIETYKHWQFKPGQASANPGGRVKNRFDVEALKAIATHYVTEVSRGELIKLLADEKRRDKLTPAHDLVLTRIGEALRKDSEGRLNFAEVMDRLIGKPTQTIDAHIQVTLEQLVLGSYTPGDDAKLIDHESNDDLV